MTRSLLLLACAGCTAPEGDAPADSDPGDPSSPYLRFLAVDNAPLSPKLALVDTRGEDEWTVALPAEPRDLALVEGDVLVSTSTGAVRVALADGAVLDTIDGFHGVQTARPLEGGNVLLGAQDGDDVTFTEVDADGKIVGTPRVVAGFSDLRLVRVLEDGHLLFTAGREGWHVFEVDGEGEVAWSAPLPGKGYVAERASDGTTLATTGEDARVVVLDEAGAVVSSWGGREGHEDLDLQWSSGFHRLDDDTVLMTNWLGHDPTQVAPHAVLFGADDEVLWTWEDPERMVQCTNVLVLEAVGVDRLDAP